MAEAVEVADAQARRPRRADAFLNSFAKLARRLDVVRQDEQLLRNEVSLRLEEPSDALDDGAGLPGPGSGDDDERPIAVLDDRALFIGEREVGFAALGGSRRRYGDDASSSAGSDCREWRAREACMPPNRSDVGSSDSTMRCVLARVHPT